MSNTALAKRALYHWLERLPEEYDLDHEQIIGIVFAVATDIASWEVIEMPCDGEEDEEELE